MAQTNVDKDSSVFQKKYVSFLQDLHQFHRDRGTPFNKLPRIGGKVLDLYQLYSRVTSLGGWRKVTEEQRWEEIQPHFNIVTCCANSAQALKQIYIRYLDVYEKVNHFGQEGHRQEVEEDATPSRKRALINTATVPLTYNYQQHDIPDYLREHYGMAKAKEFRGPDGFNKLEKALMSGLPNEVDFAMNVCTLLSNEGRHILKVEQCPRVLELLLAHCGIFSHGTDTMEVLHEDGWKSYTCRNFRRFWLETVQNKAARGLILPQELHLKSVKINKGIEFASSPFSEEADSETAADLSRNVLSLGADWGMNNVEGQRILQFAMILRNLSFEEVNMAYLSNNSPALRFILLCIHSKYSTLQQLGLDTLSNICFRMKLDSIGSPATRLVLYTLFNCLSSTDRFRVIGGLDMLTRLSQVESNEELLSDHIPEEVYEIVIRLLSIQDIHMIVCTLEALYQLSEIGEIPATQISMITRSIETLVSLVTVEAQSYGPSSLIGIKVVEHIPGGSDAVAEPPSVPRVPASTGTPHKTPTHTTVRPGLPHVPTDPGPLTQHMLQQTAHSMPSPMSASRPGSITTPPPTDSESVACNWLQAFYEVAPDSVVSKMSLYADYLTTCARCSIKGVNSNNFTNCIRVSFPKANVHMIERPGGATEIQYKGLKRRAVLLPFPPQDFASRMTSSPHSSSRSVVAGLVVNESPLTASTSPVSHVRSGGLSSQSATITIYPRIQQALTGQQPAAQNNLSTSTLSSYATIQPVLAQPMNTNKAPDSNLIKSLLANKVNQNIQRIQQTANVHSQQHVATQCYDAESSAPEARGTTTLPSRKSPSHQSKLGASRKLLPSSSVESSSSCDSGQSEPCKLASEMLEPKQECKAESQAPCGITNSQTNQTATSETNIEKVENKYVMTLEQQLEQQAKAEQKPVQTVVAANEQRKPANSVPDNSRALEQKPVGTNQLQPIQPVNGSAVVAQMMQQQTPQIPNAPLQTQSANTAVFGPPVVQVQPQQVIIQQPQHGMTLIPPVVHVAQTAAEVQQVLAGAQPPQFTLTQQINPQSMRQMLVEVPDQGQQQVVNQQMAAPTQPLPIRPQQIVLSPQRIPGQVTVQAQPICPQPAAATEPMQVPPQLIGQPQLTWPNLGQEAGDGQVNSGSILEAAVKKAGLLGGPEGDCSTPTSDKAEWQSTTDSELSIKDGVGILEQAIATAGIGCNSSSSSVIDENSVPSPSALTAGQSLMNSFPMPADITQTVNGQPSVALTKPTEPQKELPNGLSSPQSIESLSSEDSQPLPLQKSTVPNVQALNHPASKEATLSRIKMTQMLEDQIIREELLAVNGLVKHLGDGISKSDLLPAKENMKDKGVGGEEIRETTDIVSSKKILSSADCTTVANSSTATKLNGVGLGVSQNSVGCLPVDSSDTKDIRTSMVTSQGLNVVTFTSSSQLNTSTNSVDMLSGTMMGPIMNLPSGWTTVVQQPQVLNTSIGAVCEMGKQSIVSGSAPISLSSGCAVVMSSAGVPISVGGLATVGTQSIVVNSGLSTVVSTINVTSAQPSVGVQSPLKAQLNQPPKTHLVPSSLGHPVEVASIAEQQQQQQQGLVTVTGQPQVMLPMAMQSQQLKLNVINIVSQSPGQPKVLLSQPSPQLQVKSQPVLAPSPHPKQQQQQSSPQDTKSKLSNVSHKRTAKSPTGDKSAAKKRRTSRSKRSSTESQKGQQQKQPPLQLQCEWTGCKKCFESFKLINSHVLKEHQNSSGGPTSCQWEGCDGLLRQRWSFIHHLQDRHLNEASLKAAAMRRHQNVAKPNASPAASTPPPSTPAPLPQYPADAALQAIKRYSSKSPYPEFTDSKEGPVTKHIRLTSALILRNLARYSALGRSLIKRHEVHLAYIALSSMESSSAIASCLWELQKH